MPVGPKSKSASSGATQTPVRGRIPCSAARTGSGMLSASQRTSPSVKPAAMCWTTRIGIANVSGSVCRIAASACGPPVDAQTPMTEAARSAGAVSSSRPASLARGWRMTRMPLRTCTRRRRAAASAPAGSRRSIDSLCIASSAPAASAAAALAERGPTCAESTRIGVGSVAMICSTASSPDIPGSSRSIVTRSGVSRRRAAIASSAVGKTPTTSISSPSSSTRRSPCAYVGESSQMRTRRSAPPAARLKNRRAARWCRAAPAGRSCAWPCTRPRRPPDPRGGLPLRPSW